jgi:hypothetical protein
VAGNIIAEDILTVVVSQPEGTATDWETITNAVADPLTYKVCRESGICNVKSNSCTSSLRIPARATSVLTVSLSGIDGSSNQDDSSSDMLLYGVVILVGALTAGCLLFVCLCAKRSFWEEKE